MKNKIDIPIRIISVYVIISSLSLLISIYNSFLGNIPSILFSAISISYFLSGIFILKEKKVGFYLLFLSILFTLFSVESNIFSYRYSTILDILIYYTVGGEVGFDSYLGGRVALVWNDGSIQSTRFSVDLIAGAILFFTTRYFFNTYKLEESSD